MSDNTNTHTNTGSDVASVRAFVNKLVCKRTWHNSVEDTAYLVGDAGCDDLDVIEIIFELEDKYSIDIQDCEFENDMTVSELADIVIKHLSTDT